VRKCEVGIELEGMLVERDRFGRFAFRESVVGEAEGAKRLQVRGCDIFERPCRVGRRRHRLSQPASQLGAEQSARLAAYLPNPKRYGRVRSGPYLDKRTADIARYMADAIVP
jgi:hypothetical protein